MSLQANWHVGDLVLPDVDPLQQMSQLQSDATVIDLTGTTGEIEARIAESVEKEGRYEESCGLSCALKWKSDHRLMGGRATSCHVCPQFTQNPDEARMLVCRLGRRQERLLDALEARKTAEALEREFIEAVERDLDASEELAEAHLAAV